jgi:soluble lytic murein transglycosylase-like protein
MKRRHADQTTKLSRVLLGALALSCMAFATVARADIYSFVDEDGVTHYTNVPDDSRFVLFQKTGDDRVVMTAERAAGWKDRSHVFASIIDLTARRTEVHPALLKAVIAAESAFDPYAVSKAGAQGLMQLHPNTAKRYGVADPFDPAANVDGGARYLHDLLRRFDNNLELALAAYNAGEEAVERHGRHIPPYAETQAYVPTVLRLYRRFLTQHS